MKNFFIIIITAIIVFLATLFVSEKFEKNENYSACILKKIKNAKDQTLISTLKQECNNNYHNNNSTNSVGEIQSINQKIDQLFDILNYMKSKMKSLDQDSK